MTRTDKSDHDVTYTHSGDPRAAGTPTTGVPINPTGKGVDAVRHPNTGRFEKGKR